MRRIGVLINTMYADYSVMVLRGIKKYCDEHDCTYFVFPLAHGTNSGLYDYHYETLFEFINKNNIEGLLIVTTSLAYDVNLPKVIHSIKLLPPLPKVSLGFDIEGIPTIKISCGKAIRTLVDHLVKKHNVKKPIILRCSKGNFESDEREKYFVETFEEYGIIIEQDRILSGSFLFDNAYALVSNFIRKYGADFDAVVCLNDTMAMGAYKALIDNNVDIPTDAVVTGFDNIAETATDELDITTIDQRIEEFSYLAMNNVCEMVDGRQTDLQTSLDAMPVYRASCGCKHSDAIVAADENFKVSQQRHEIVRMSGTQLYMLHYFLMETQTPVSLENLYSRLHYSLCLFDIHSFAMVLYDRPVLYEKDTIFRRPDSAKVVMTFFNGDTYERPDVVFNPIVAMLPPDIAQKMKGGYVVFPLFAEKVQYGYLFFNFGRYERIFYQTVYELLAKEIITSIKISFEQSEKDSLKDQNVSLEEYSQKMHALSFTDEMTGLLNRRGFYEYARRRISSAVKSDKRGLLIYFDMDDLKKINDTYGHDAGDRAIKYETQILRSIFRSSDILGRLGGDEFAVIASGMTPKDFPRIKKSLQAECDKINSGTLDPFVLSISCGYSEFNSENNNIDELLTSADSSQYEDKRAKKQRKNKTKRFAFWRK